MLSLFVIIGLTAFSIWFFFRSIANDALVEAKNRHPAAQRCKVCAPLNLPALHPSRIHGEGARCTICEKRIDRDGWDSHWRLNHIPRATGAEDRADWPSRKDH